MATKGFKSPFMASVAVTATSTAQDLYTLLSAVWSDIPHKGCFIQVQLNSDAASAHLYVGNSNVSPTMAAYDLIAGIAMNPLRSESNLWVLDHIFLVSSAGTLQANVIVGVR